MSVVAEEQRAEKVLVVDDDPTTRNVVSKLLKLLGYERKSFFSFSVLKHNSYGSSRRKRGARTFIST
jgi:FixJ family two-component response regulator